MRSSSLPTLSCGKRCTTELCGADVPGGAATPFTAGFGVAETLAVASVLVAAGKISLPCFAGAV